MITALRRYLKSRAFKIVLWITILAVAGVFSIFEVFQSSFKTRKWIAKINGSVIEYPEFLSKVAQEEQLTQLLRAKFGAYADLVLQMRGMSTDPHERALEDLIKQQLLLQVARKMGITIHPDYRMAQLADKEFVQENLGDVIPPHVFDAAGNLDIRTLHMYLQNAGISMQHFEQKLDQALARQLALGLVVSSCYIPEFELQSIFARLYSPHKFSLVTLSFSTLLETVKKESVTDEQLKAFYQEQNTKAKKYWVPEKREGTVWTFTPSTYRITLDPKDIQAYYERHKNEYVDQPMQLQVRRILFKIDDPAQEEAVRSRAQKVREELIAKPDSFAQVAKEISADEATAAQGGLLPAFAKGSQEKEFEMPAFLLKADNDISSVIKTSKGFEIIQRVSKKAGTFKPLSSVQDTISTTLTQKQFAAQFPGDVRSVVEKAKQNPQALVDFVKDKGGKKQAVTVTSQDATKQAQTLFKLAKNGLNYITQDNQGEILQLTDIKERHLPEFASVKEQVKQDWYAQQANERMQELVKQVKTLLLAGDTTKLAQLPGVSITQTQWLKATETEALKVLEQKGIPANELFQLEIVNSLLAVPHEPDTYVIRLDALGAFDKNLYEQKRAEVKQQAMENQASMQAMGFVASLYRTATIKTNPSPAETQY
jgi:parvulin-like peptidyl-prolyl isomerase